MSSCQGEVLINSATGERSSGPASQEFVVEERLIDQHFQRMRYGMISISFFTQVSLQSKPEPSLKGSCEAGEEENMVTCEEGLSSFLQFP